MCRGESRVGERHDPVELPRTPLAVQLGAMAGERAGAARRLSGWTEWSPMAMLGRLRRSVSAASPSARRPWRSFNNSLPPP